MSISHNEYDIGGPIAYINVTPLVDVMLVLLVIFMITAPILQQGVEVNLPKATTAPLAGSSEQIVVSINKAGKVFIGSGNEVVPAEIGKRMEAIMKLRKVEDQKVYIKADMDVEYGIVMEIMGNLHASGIHQIGLVSEPKT